ncbi:MAG TPA: hypothetical protein VN083_02915 [Vicinamibacteria bacterium]|nr:hypothetical protein [Vicinamibacteria bacterium]
MRGLVPLLCVLSLGAAEEGSGGLLVHFKDGSALPLRSWALSVEFSTWPQGESAASATVSRKDSRQLTVGKKEYPLGDLASFEIEYEPPPKALQDVRPPLARGFVLKGRHGEVTHVRLEAPSRDILLPGKGHGLMFAARSLDLVGETIMGTKRSLCLLSYTSLVECGLEPKDQITSLDFSE